ncbi:MAG: thiol:disulfide interchange protein DsbA/DsbL [Lysobacteraceae bacterium]
MLTRSALLLSLLIATTACTASPDVDTTTAASAAAPVSAQAAAAPTTAATDTAAAAELAASAATAAAATSADAAASPMASVATDAAMTGTAAIPAGMPAGPAPVLGKDYFVIDTPDSESGKTINVTEVFGYSCPHCAHFQPYVDKWKKTLPSDVHFSYMPAAFGGIWESFARAYYTAEVMGVLQKSHEGIYNAVHVQRRPITNANEIAALYADYGVDPKVFGSTMQSFAINAKVAGSKDQATRWGIDATPTIVVAGKYRVLQTSAGSEEQYLHNVDWLVAKERAERKAKKS